MACSASESLEFLTHFFERYIEKNRLLKAHR